MSAPALVPAIVNRYMLLFQRAVRRYVPNRVNRRQTAQRRFSGVGLCFFDGLVGFGWEFFRNGCNGCNRYRMGRWTSVSVCRQRIRVLRPCIAESAPALMMSVSKIRWRRAVWVELTSSFQAPIIASSWYTTCARPMPAAVWRKWFWWQPAISAPRAPKGANNALVTTTPVPPAGKYKRGVFRAVRGHCQN